MAKNKAPQIPRRQVRLMFFDEARFGRISDIAYLEKKILRIVSSIHLKTSPLNYAKASKMFLAV